MGSSQAVRHRTLTATYIGSNPFSPEHKEMTMLDRHKVNVPKANPNNRVIRPSDAQMLASPKEDIDAVIFYGSAPTLEAKEAYRVVGQPVSKG